MEYKNKPCRTGAWVLTSSGYIYTACPERYQQQEGKPFNGFVFYELPPQLKP